MGEFPAGIWSELVGHAHNSDVYIGSTDSINELIGITHIIIHIGNDHHPILTADRVLALPLLLLQILLQAPDPLPKPHQQPRLFTRRLHPLNLFHNVDFGDSAFPFALHPCFGVIIEQYQPE